MTDEIRAFRERFGLTQVQLGERLKVHPNTIARWERSEVTPENPDVLRRALEHLALEIEEERRKRGPGRPPKSRPPDAAPGRAD